MNKYKIHNTKISQRMKNSKINLALIGCGKITGEKKHIYTICKNSEFINLSYTFFEL